MYIFKVPCEYEIYMVKNRISFLAMQFYAFYVFFARLMMTLIGRNM